MNEGRRKNPPVFRDISQYAQDRANLLFWKMNQRGGGPNGVEGVGSKGQCGEVSHHQRQAFRTPTGARQKRPSSVQTDGAESFSPKIAAILGRAAPQIQDRRIFRKDRDKFYEQGRSPVRPFIPVRQISVRLFGITLKRLLSWIEPLSFFLIQLQPVFDPSKNGEGILSGGLLQEGQRSERPTLI